MKRSNGKESTQSQASLNNNLEEVRQTLWVVMFNRNLYKVGIATRTFQRTVMRMTDFSPKKLNSLYLNWRRRDFHDLV